jgi:glycosyltransferase involved in cell wall biosynthesis
VRIAFDVSPLSHRQTGVGTYIREALEGLVSVAGGAHEIVAFAPTSAAGRRRIEGALAALPVERRIRVLPFAHAWRTAWSRLGRPPAERVLGRFDVLHFWDWMYPPQRGGVRSTMIHDLVPLHFPEWVTGRTRSMHAAKYANAARTCDLVFANCEFTADDVVETLRVPRDRVRVAYPGVEPIFSPAGRREELGRPYVLTVATLEPRKNLAALLDAHRLLAGDLALAVAGPAGWGDQAPVAGERVLALGYVSRQRLPALYRGAAVFVYPSRFEGFGIPVIEAMASGVPCVISSHPSLDEAAGQAAVRVDPESPAAIAAGIEQALAGRDDLVRRGREHAGRFPWEGTGRAFLAGFEQVL